MDFLSTPHEPAEVLLIVPPFAGISMPSLGVHLLQAIARQAGYGVDVLYGNLIFAEMIGEQTYEAILDKSRNLLQERVFCHQALGTEAPSRKDFEACGLDCFDRVNGKPAKWVERMETIIFERNYRIIGATSSFEQTTSSVAILNRCKAHDPNLLTCMGGANCEEIMAEGIHSLNASIDYVFSGESEETFVAFLEQVLGRGERPSERIFYGRPCQNLDSLPTPNYDEFFEQRSRILPLRNPNNENRLAISYESSRGCWWGQKNHCTFCGLNGGGMAFREKSPDRVLTDLQGYRKRYGVSWFNIVDNIMPHRFFKTLLPRLAEEMDDEVSVFYEQKSNITLEKALLLKRARVNRIQPGIEAINTNILNLMRKGVSARQNLNLLRYGRCLGIHIEWNLLTGFPGDQQVDYDETLELIKLIPHLQPPGGVTPIVFHRFSPYFDQPDRYGISNLRPKPAYFKVFPTHSRVEHLAYAFEGDYETGALTNAEFSKVFLSTVNTWVDAWSNPAEKKRPVMWLDQLSHDNFVLMDTRGLPGTEDMRFLNREEARAVLLGGSLKARARLEWALEQKLLTTLDHWLVPLATAPPEVIQQFEVELPNRSQERLAV